MQSGISDYLSDTTRHGSGFGLEIVKITKSIMVNKNLKLSAYYSRDHANGKIDGYKNEVIKYSSSLLSHLYSDLPSIPQILSLTMRSIHGGMVVIG